VSPITEVARAPEDCLLKKKLFTGIKALRMDSMRDVHGIHIPSLNSSLLSLCNILPTGKHHPHTAGNTQQAMAELESCWKHSAATGRASRCTEEDDREETQATKEGSIPILATLRCSSENSQNLKTHLFPKKGPPSPVLYMRLAPALGIPI
jgi:hypothetical protein